MVDKIKKLETWNVPLTKIVCIVEEAQNKLEKVHCHVINLV